MTECIRCGRVRELNDNNLCENCQMEIELEQERKPKVSKKKLLQSANQQNTSFVFTDVRVDNKKTKMEIEKRIKKAEKALVIATKKFNIALDVRKKAEDELKQAKGLLGGKKLRKN